MIPNAGSSWYGQDEKDDQKANQMKYAKTIYFECSLNRGKKIRAIACIQGIFQILDTKRLYLFNQGK